MKRTVQRKSCLFESGVAQLPEEQRQAIEMAYFQGLTQVAIAQKTNTKLNTVKTLIRLGLTKLKTLLASTQKS